MALYRTRDSLKNFYIRVELRKVTSTLLRDNSRFTSTQANTAGQGQDTEAWVFRWQEKVFSQHEEELFADANNCTSALEDNYHRDILALRSEGGRPNNRLFCYLDSDHFHTPVEEVGQQLTDDDIDYQTFASRFSSAVRRRHVGRRKDYGGFPGGIRDPVSDKPNLEERVSHRIVTPPSQCMYIMADLRRMDGLRIKFCAWSVKPNQTAIVYPIRQDEGDEHVLCLLTVDSRGMVSVSPDFNHDRPAYRLENRHREVFEYRLEHVSNEISHEERTKELRVLSELYSRHAGYLSSCVGKTFADPPESCALRVLLMGEIVSAQGFEYDDLYVTAHLELPEWWLVAEDSKQPLSVVTQICRTKSKHKYNVAHFSCPFEFELEYNNPTLTSDRLPKWPRVLLEVSSLDYWDRHRIEGYGFADLPCTPGAHDLTVNTWRPSGFRVLDKMKRFFVGGAPEIDDISYVAQPRDFQGTHLSKYGFRTESTGSVRLRFNITHQSSLIMERLQTQDTSRLLKYRGFKPSVAAVLDAYQRAKERAAAVIVQ